MNNPRTVIVTGAGSGIGKAAADMLARHACQLVLVGRREGPLRKTQEAIAEHGNTAHRVLACDVTDAGAGRRIVEACAEAFGGVDAVLSNAGGTRNRALPDITDDDIAFEFAVNLLGPLSLLRAAWPEFARAHGRGVTPAFVAVSSIASIDPFPGLGVYGCAKAGLNTLAKACVNEGSDIGIRAYSVAPGAVETPLLRSIIDDVSLPTAMTLAPADVAKVAVECLLGETSEPNGSTIVLNSPAAA